MKSIRYSVDCQNDVDFSKPVNIFYFLVSALISILRTTYLIENIGKVCLLELEKKEDGIRNGLS